MTPWKFLLGSALFATRGAIGQRTSIQGSRPDVERHRCYGRLPQPANSRHEERDHGHR